MGVFDFVIQGFQVALQPHNIAYCFGGVLIGTLIGVLPGLGPTATIAILLPTTFDLSPVTGIIMLAGIYYGAMYGGSTTSILVNIPGEASSVVTCLDGHAMAKQGRAGPALGISAIGSFIGGTVAIIGLMFLAYPLAEQAIKFGPAEYVALMCLGLTLVTYVSKGSLLKAWIMALVGLFLGTVGIDGITGTLRFTFGIAEMTDGIGLVPVAMGLFGIAEVLANIGQSEKITIYSGKITNLLPNLEDWKNSAAPIIRGSFLGFFLGILPGGGTIVSSFASYAIEKKVSKEPRKFGHGAIEGVAGPETANNSATAGAFVPLLSFGIPSNVVMALILGALLIHGITPGPLLINEHPDLFWGVIASMYVGNLMLLVLNLPLIGLWVKILKVPGKILLPLILLFCMIGAYTINYNVFDVLVMIIFGFIGYFLRKFEYEEAPLVLAFVLGPLLEKAFCQTMIIANGDFSIFFRRPISATLLLLAAGLLISNALGIVRAGRRKMADQLEA